jgi:RNA recognition motif-containing protein
MQELNNYVVSGSEVPLQLKYSHSAGPRDTAAAAEEREELPTYDTIAGPSPSHPSSSSGPVNLWIGNLPPTHTDAEIKELCQPHGQVLSLKVLPSKRGPGYGNAALVLMQSAQQAKTALEQLNGIYVTGFEKPLIVKYSVKAPGQPKTSTPPTFAPSSMSPNLRPSIRAPYRPPTSSSTSFTAPRGGPGAPRTLGTNLWVGNLPKDLSEGDLTSVFGVYGSVIECVVLKIRGTSESAGAGMVRMSSALECHNAKHNLHGVSLLPGLAPFVIKFASGGFGSHEKVLRKRTWSAVAGAEPPFSSAPPAKRMPTYI